MLNQPMGSYDPGNPSRQAQVPARVERIKKAMDGHMKLLKELEGRIVSGLRPPGSFQSPPVGTKAEEELVGFAKELEDILQAISEADTVVNSMLHRLEL